MTMLQAVSIGEATSRAVEKVGERIGSRIDVRGVSRRFGRVSVLEGLHLSVEPGEFLTLLGPSGSGKTTLLQMIAGFQPIDAGEILVDGAPIHGVASHLRGFGMVFQNYALFPHMTVSQNVAFPLRMAGVDRASSRAARRRGAGDPSPVGACPQAAAATVAAASSSAWRSDARSSSAHAWS